MYIWLVANGLTSHPEPGRKVGILKTKDLGQRHICLYMKVDMKFENLHTKC